MFNAEKLGDRKPFQLLHHMQQLLGDKASTTDGAFLHELFLQRLLANVHIVLASTPDNGNLEELVPTDIHPVQLHLDPLARDSYKIRFAGITPSLVTMQESVSHPA